MPDVGPLSLTIAVDTARRFSPHAVEAAVAEARQVDDPSLINWRAAGLWGGYAGLAVLAASLDTVEPGCGWDSIGFDHLRRAVRGMEAEQSPAVGMAGLTGLATAASLLSRDGRRYDTLLTTLESAIVERVEHMSQGVLRSRPHGVQVGLFDVIGGLAGAGRYLLSRAQSAPCRRALETLLRALIYLSKADADAVPHLHTTFRQSTDNLRKLYPDGHVNLGMAHGIPGPLALLSLSASQGVEVEGQHDAIVRIADRIVKAQCSDEWGVGFPVAASILTVCKERTSADLRNMRASANAAAPARAAWCYGPPGVARALWLAGVASGRSEYRDLALAAMTAVFERPIPNRRIDSPTLCHGVAGLLQITLRFARDGAGEIFSNAAQELTAQLLDAHEPDSRFGYRDLKPSGQRADNPGLLEGAAGVALVLLATATSAEPVWDRILMLS
ncbi:lanthionine synthetase C family protein [Taklimakanibacter deserti]|uniref:lanthionine synthetase C family protein n=1 Tax=Taklimakanibacter deserti TaxID=2267839 RepID=UPI0013C4DE21